MVPLMKTAGSSLLSARSSLLCITCLAGAPEFRSNFEGTRCFVENLSSDTDWAMLKDHFRNDNYPVVYASVSEDRETGRSKGHGIVQFETSHAAEHAIEFMTGSVLDGQSINVRADRQEASRRGRGQYETDKAPRGGHRGRATAGGPPSKDWRRVAGSDDDETQVDEGRVRQLLEARDSHRERRDFGPADQIRDELWDMGISVDDALRQKCWWVGRRVEDARPARSSEQRKGGASPGRRKWYNDGGGSGGGGGGGQRRRPF